MIALSFVQQDVEINTAWAFIDGLDAAELLLDGLESVKQCERIKLGLDLRAVSISAHSARHTFPSACVMENLPRKRR